MKRVAILQSNYIPWKGYFDLMNRVDLFLVFDQVQYTKNDWRNRNRIKTQAGTQWLTIPVFHGLDQKINETRVSTQSWRARHWKSLVQNYGSSAHFKTYKERFRALYLDQDTELLSEINFSFMTEIATCLGIGTHLAWACDQGVPAGRTQRLVNLCLQAGATDYLSGPSATAYLEEDLFRKAGISVSYMEYTGYPEYSQLHPPFEHAVTILDLLFNEGPRSTHFMKSFDQP